MLFIYWKIVFKNRFLMLIWKKKVLDWTKRKTQGCSDWNTCLRGSCHRVTEWWALHCHLVAICVNRGQLCLKRSDKTWQSAKAAADFRSQRVKMIPSVTTAYRIHVNQSTVDILNSLKLGYKIQVRGLTELKVINFFLKLKKTTRHKAFHKSHWLFILRAKGLRTHIGW